MTEAGAEAGAEYRADRELVVRAIRARASPVKLLVFGTGFDSRFWKSVTAVIDLLCWFERMSCGNVALK